MYMYQMQNISHHPNLMLSKQYTHTQCLEGSTARKERRFCRMIVIVTSTFFCLTSPLLNCYTLIRNHRGEVPARLN